MQNPGELTSQPRDYTPDIIQIACIHPIEGAILTELNVGNRIGSLEIIGDSKAGKIEGYKLEVRVGYNQEGFRYCAIDHRSFGTDEGNNLIDLLHRLYPDGDLPDILQIIGESEDESKAINVIDKLFAFQQDGRILDLVSGKGSFTVTSWVSDRINTSMSFGRYDSGNVDIAAHLGLDKRYYQKNRELNRGGVTEIIDLTGVTGVITPNFAQVIYGARDPQNKYRDLVGKRITILPPGHQAAIFEANLRIIQQVWKFESRVIQSNFRIDEFSTLFNGSANRLAKEMKCSSDNPQVKQLAETEAKGIREQQIIDRYYEIASIQAALLADLQAEESKEVNPDEKQE